MLGRGLLRRCPFCGAGGLFADWFHLKPQCPTCKHHFRLEEGFFTGAYALNFAFTQALVLLALIPYLVLSARNPNRELNVLPFATAGVLATLLGPVIFYPFSRTLWVALDMAVRGGRNFKEH